MMNANYGLRIFGRLLLLVFLGASTVGCQRVIDYFKDVFGEDVDPEVGICAIKIPPQIKVREESNNFSSPWVSLFNDTLLDRARAEISQSVPFTDGVYRKIILLTPPVSTSIPTTCGKLINGAVPGSVDYLICMKDWADKAYPALRSNCPESARTWFAAGTVVARQSSRNAVVSALLFPLEDFDEYERENLDTGIILVDGDDDSLSQIAEQAGEMLARQLISKIN